MLVFFAALLPVVILFCGLSVDAAMLHLKALQMQNAADAAALGAELEWERATGNQVAQGMADAAVNGFTNGANNVRIAIGAYPSSGPYASRYDAQYAKITQTVTTIFMGSLSGGQVTLSATGVSLMPPCGYLMNTAGISNAYTLNITNSQSVSAQGMFSRCPLYINPNIYLASSIALDNDAILATGSPGQTSLLGQNSPPPTYGSLTVTDPLASLTQPTASACTHTNFSFTSGSTTLNPGTYCGSASTPGMTLKGGGNIYFNAGLYVITGGFHATDVNLSSAGVTLFFTKGGSAPYGQVIFDGDSQVDLNAPTASSGGALVNILFFTDRNWTHTSAQDFQLNDAEYYGNGIWYINGTGVQLTAESSTWSSGYIALVTNSVYVDSSTLNLFSDFSSIPTGNPFRTRAVLVQ